MPLPCLSAARTVLTDRRGATAIEYGLIAALIAIAAIVGMRALGGSVLGLWTGVNDKVSAVPAQALE